MLCSSRTTVAFLFVSSIFFSYNTYCQDSLQRECIDISKISAPRKIATNIESAYISKNESLESVFRTIRFEQGVIHKKNIPNNYVTKKSIVKFSVCNSGDTTIGVYFFPGLHYRDIKLYKQESDQLVKIPSILPKNINGQGYRLISVANGDSAIIIVELSFVKTYTNYIRPRLINAESVDSFISDLHNLNNSENTFTYIFSGVLLMMVLFSLAGYLQGSNREFLFYAGYAFFMGSMLFTKSLYNSFTNPLNYFLEGYFDFILQGAGILCYTLFMQKFLTTKNDHRFLYHMYNAGIVVVIISLLTYSWFHYFSNNFTAENGIENITKILLLLLVVTFLVYSVRHWKNRLFRYLFWGNLFLLFFSFLSQLNIMMRSLFQDLPDLLQSALIYYEIGLFMELIFFLVALNYKTTKRLVQQTKERESLKAENLMKEYEKELAVLKAQKDERERISADMHDELGSGMTAIRLLSEIARNKMKENTPVELEKISQSANDVLNKMNAIIWSMDSGNDSLDNLISYIRVYALEFFEGTSIDCKVNMPTEVPLVELSGDKRRNTFLSLKETLTNALKHSQATHVTIDICANHSVEIKITDDGIGVDKEHMRQFGNGLKNIARRMESIGGTFHIETNNGTVTTLGLPL